MSSREFVTSSVGCAAFLLFTLGDGAHVATSRDGTGTAARFFFTFQNPEGNCSELKAAFFNGAGVDDAKALLDCQWAIRQTIRQADKDPSGIWLRGESND